METSFLGLALAAILILQFSTPINSSFSATTSLPSRNKYIEYIKTSCYKTTIYPKLCYHTLAIYASTIKTNPKLLAKTALNSTSRLMIRVSKIPALEPRLVAAVLDCVEEVGDSVYELQRSIEEMGHAGGSDFSKAMSDIETWVSAALTDDDTCLDGFAEGVMNKKVTAIVKRHVQRIARLTSNALALVNIYASTQANLP
ncbi:invertase/pectin methylesterase inhibitor family protein [Populus alba x Populus x berolinensis]|uniref:Invertase/pectin methylesterase inhibitor family protein n=1 Tax=Populus alba x Populus x berolinensis TaxID=444605 RepID=A0AAD6RL92_9ROSI|nr:invertase/pectin methylesterase inhibitor family protein [Populus alba x Populus x berolinensis]